MEEALPVAQWMLVLGDRILAMGKREDAWPAQARNLTPIEIQGECVLPGFIDAHCHLHQYLYRYIALMSQGEKSSLPLPASYSRWLDFSAMEDKASFLQKIEQEAITRSPGEWILGGGWHNLDILPHCQEIDRISPQNPVFLRDASLHSALLNTKALEIFSIQEDTHDPIGGRIDRDPRTNSPTGLLFEQAIFVAQKKIPPLPQKVLSLLAAKAMRYMNQYGITGIHDMENCDYFEIFPALSWLLFQHPEDFTVRCLCALTIESWQEFLKAGKIPGMGNEMLRLGHLKLIYDGSLGARTAYMNTPYPDSQYRGEELISRSEVRHTVKEALKRSIPLAIHGIGDRATQNIAEIFLEYRPQKLPCSMMHRIEHIQAASPDVIGSLAKCGVAFSVQPIHIPGDLDSTERLQPHLLEHTHAYRTMLDFGKKYGVPLVLGTDFPVASINPLWNIYSAITRSLPIGNSSHKWSQSKDCLTRKEAIHAYTYAPAQVSGEAAIKGSLLPGKLADFVSVSHDLLEEKDNDVFLKSHIKSTYIGGRCVYHA